MDANKLEVISRVAAHFLLIIIRIKMILSFPCSVYLYFLRQSKILFWYFAILKYFDNRLKFLRKTCFFIF